MEFLLELEATESCSGLIVGILFEGAELFTLALLESSMTVASLLDHDGGKLIYNFQMKGVGCRASIGCETDLLRDE